VALLRLAPPPAEVRPSARVEAAVAAPATSPEAGLLVLPLDSPRAIVGMSVGVAHAGTRRRYTPASDLPLAHEAETTGDRSCTGACGSSASVDHHPPTPGTIVACGDARSHRLGFRGSFFRAPPPDEARARLFSLILPVRAPRPGVGLRAAQPSPILDGGTGPHGAGSMVRPASRWVTFHEQRWVISRERRRPCGEDAGHRC
jgi:hypothetical protein